MSGAGRNGTGVGTSSAPDLVLINGQPWGPDRASLSAGVAADPDAQTAGGGSVPRGGISPLDRGLHFGDGVFETLACRRGRARFLSLHIERLVSSCNRLRIDLGNPAALAEEIRGALVGTDATLLKLIVTRGEAVVRGYAPSGRESATRVLLRYGWPQEDVATQREGIQVRVAHMRLGENPALAGMKHLNRLEQVLARAEVSSQEAAELLMFGASGQLVSGTMSNVFIVQQGRLQTPHIDTCGVAGVMRRVVLREATKAGIAVDECMLSAQDLATASEVFLTNARVGIWPVSTLDDRRLPCGETTRRLQALIAPMLENPVDA